MALIRRCAERLSVDLAVALLVLGIGLLLSPIVAAQPWPHHFSGITVAPDRSVTLSLNGSVSNLVSGLSGTISNQFMQMFDLYQVEASTNLVDWEPLALWPRTNNDPKPLLIQDTNATDSSRRFYRTFTNHMITPFPKPAGPFAVGTIDRAMVDPTRTNLYRYSPATNAFMVTCWYPAEPPEASVLPSPMWDAQFAADPTMGLYTLIGYDTRWTKVLPLCVGHRFKSLPLAANTGRFPVVIYSHGNKGSRLFDTQRAEELASHGYVVIAPDHSDCHATEFPDGRYLKGGSGDIPGRLKDMTFLLDELARLNQEDPFFRDRLDLERIGLYGHSYGGLVVETCRADPRAKCAVLFDTTNLKYNSAGLQKPFLAITAPRSQFPSFRAENDWLFNQAVTNAIWVDINDADHFVFCDTAWGPLLPEGGRLSAAATACTLWFFNTYLKSETPPFPTNPEISTLKRKCDLTAKKSTAKSQSKHGLILCLAAWREIPSFSGRSRVGIDEAMPSIWLMLRTLTFLDTDSMRTLHLKNQNL